MRLYSFVNGLYFSPIQHGIQTGHCGVDILRKYAKLDNELTPIVNEWADFHKTFIILNAFNLAGLKEALRIFSSSGLAFCPFYEDQEAVGGILTCVAAVVPSNIYNANKNVRMLPDSTLESVEWVLEDGTVVSESGDLFEFISFIKSARTA